MSREKRSSKSSIFRFFPLLLLLALAKHNRISLFFWLVLWLIVSGNLFSGYGLYNLFLYPEYLGRIDFTSHAILGFSVGGVIMAFNMTGYILHGSKFPIIATLNRPFLKYCLNNFILPLAFVVYYTVLAAQYQIKSELDDVFDVVVRMLGFYLGMFIFISLTLTYFFRTNLSLRKLTGLKPEQSRGRKRKNPKTMTDLFSAKSGGEYVMSRRGKFRVHFYLSWPIKIKPARDSRHYDADTLRAVFSQNHVNASLFEVVTIVSIVFFSFMRETPVFQLPAAASITLLFTVILMFAGAVYSWLKDASLLFFIALLFLYNFISSHPEYSFKSYAYGLRYSGEKADYNSREVLKFATDTGQIEREIKTGNEILRRRVSAVEDEPNKKPKLVFINCSGGGLRASMWTYRVLQHLDSCLNNRLLDYTVLMSGSSGGMWGAAYYREMYRQSKVNSSINPGDSIYLERIGSEVLNNVALSFTLHDWLIRTRTFDYAGESYTKDRGYSFERKFSENTTGVLDKQMFEYRKQEEAAEIPQMILSPTIANDGRRLLISSLPVSYLSAPHYTNHLRTDTDVESIDYRRLLENQNPDSLSFLSALRMSSTFFYVLPNVTLPTNPSVEVLDAGIRDNSGILNTIRFLNAHKDFINERTSGVVIIQIHDRYKKVPRTGAYERSFLRTLSAPLSAVYGNYLNIQHFSQDEILSHTALNIESIDVLRFELMTEEEEDISLSWRLTNKEKNRIKKAVYRDENELSSKILKELMR